MALKNTWATGEAVTATDLNATADEILGINAAGVYASRPAAGHPGRTYDCTDNGNRYRDNGTSWDLVSVAGSGIGGTEPPSAGWTTSTMGSATLAADKGGRLLTIPSAAGENWRYERRTLSPTSNYTITGFVEATPFAPGTDSFYTGLILGDGTKLYSFGLFSLASTAGIYQTGWNLHVRKWANATTFSAEGANFYPSKLGCRPNWLRIRDDATTLFFEYSVNGIHWCPVFSEARTTFLTASVYGWGGNNSSGSSGLVRLSSLSLA
jgi:hypothetical protein